MCVYFQRLMPSSLNSTVTALLEAIDNWAFNIDRGNVNAVLCLVNGSLSRICHLNAGYLGE